MTRPDLEAIRHRAVNHYAFALDDECFDYVEDDIVLLLAYIADLEAYYATAMQTPCPDEQHCTCVPALQRRIADLEEQLHDMQAFENAAGA